MTTPENDTRFPTIDSPEVVPLTTPTAQELHALYGDLILDIIGINLCLDDDVRAAASAALNHGFYKNPEAIEGSEICISGAKAIYTRDATMITDIVEDQIGRAVDPDDVLPEVVKFDMIGTEDLQGFFNSFYTGPLFDLAPSGESVELFGFGVRVDGLLVRHSSTDGIPAPPRYFPGHWLVVMGDAPEIGLVQ